jgi:uncharacterized membrane protein YpjA
MLGQAESAAFSPSARVPASVPKPVDWDRVWAFFHRFKANRWWVAALMVPNLLGIIFGYYYYWEVGQFNPHSSYFRAYGWWPFIPDSPNAVVLMAASLLLYQWGGRRSRILDGLAFTAMIYVGLWTTALFLTYPEQLGTFHWGGTNNVLFFSHMGMPLEALLLVRDLRRDPVPYTLAAGLLLWNVGNLWLDYGPVHLHPAPFVDDHTPMHAFSPWLMAIAMLAWLWAVQSGLGRPKSASPPPEGDAAAR